MKAGSIHRVPLSETAQAILRQVGAFRSGANGPLFPGRGDRPLGDATMLGTLRDLDPTASVHGFRSAFRDWCGNETNTPREIAEACLAHAVGSSVEQAYRRSDALEKRRTLMEMWSSYCSGETSGKVVSIGRRS
jgi:integrase